MKNKQRKSVNTPLKPVNKLAGRISAKAQLELQLEKGLKPNKYGGKGKEEFIPLETIDRARIEAQIKKLSLKIEYAEKKKISNKSTSIPVVKVTPVVVKEVRTSHPKTKLYTFINGIYRKIRTKKGTFA